RAEPPDEAVVARLRREHKLMQELALPGVVRVLDLVRLGGGVALVLERWGESSLDAVLKRAALPVETVLRLGAALARTLGQVHERGVLHRDVKPQNVLVNADRSDVRLIDFGSATRSGRTLGEAAVAEDLTGTLAYIAPEQTGRTNRVVDARADLY